MYKKITDEIGNQTAKPLDETRTRYCSATEAVNKVLILMENIELTTEYFTQK